MCFIFQGGQITPQLALKVLLQFDKAINNALAHKVKNRVNFKVRSGKVYELQHHRHHWHSFVCQWCSAFGSIKPGVHHKYFNSLMLFKSQSLFLFCEIKSYHQMKLTSVPSIFSSIYRLIFVRLSQGHLNTYRFCDNVWTFVLDDVEFKDVQEITKVDKVKIVACDGKSELIHGPFVFNSMVSRRGSKLFRTLHPVWTALQLSSLLLEYILALTPPPWREYGWGPPNEELIML